MIKTLNKSEMEGNVYNLIVYQKLSQHRTLGWKAECFSSKISNKTRILALTISTEYWTRVSSQGD